MPFQLQKSSSMKCNIAIEQWYKNMGWIPLQSMDVGLLWHSNQMRSIRKAEFKSEDYTSRASPAGTGKVTLV